VSEQQLRKILASTLELVREQQATLFEQGWEIAALRDALREVEPKAAEFLLVALVKYRSRDLDAYDAFQKRFAELIARLTDV